VVVVVLLRNLSKLKTLSTVFRDEETNEFSNCPNIFQVEFLGLK